MVLSETLCLKAKLPYIEVLDKEQNRCCKGKVRLTNLLTKARFVPQMLASGNYLVRAYTNWMKKLEYFFSGFYKR